jgi:peptide/nickel transport system substrate-binding protein
VVNQIYDRLVHIRPGTSVLEPGLAVKWKASDMGRVWEFELRRGVKFHDGTPFNADAVVFSFERQRDPFHPFHRPDFQYWENVFRNIERVEKVDEYKVRIHIEGPYAPFLANLSMFAVSIVSPTAVRRYGKTNNFSNNPVGTGPWRFKSWTKGERIVLERNPDYWGGPPAMERMVFQVIQDPRQRLIALESGAIDIAYSILPEELQFVELHPSLDIHKVAANNVAYLAMNTRRQPFDDVRVRRAANYAINKEPIVKLVYQGLAIPAHGAVPPGNWAYYEVKQRYGYNPAMARQLLAEAQAEGRFDPTTTLSLYVPTTPRPYLPNPERIGRVLQANLKAVGIKTRMVLQPFRKHIKSVQAGKHDLCLLGWVGDNGDPDNFLYVLFHRDNTVKGIARNVAFFTDPDNNGVNGLLTVAQESLDQSDRKRFYAQVQEILAKEAPWVPLAHAEVVVATRNDIGGVVINPSSQVSYKNVRRIDR